MRRAKYWKTIIQKRKKSAFSQKTNSILLIFAPMIWFSATLDGGLETERRRMKYEDVV